MFLLSMRKSHIIFSLFIATVLLLAGCSNSSGDKTGGKTTGGSKGKANTYKEVETIELEGYVVKTGFYLDETGDILYWGEEETIFSNDELGRYVWVDGDVESLDMDIYDHSTLLSESGTLFNNKSDFNREPNHSLLEYDPRTKEEKEFLVDENYDHLIHVGRGRFLEDPKAYIHTVTNPDLEGVDTYIWNVETGDYIDLTIIQDLKEYVDGEFSLYPQFMLTKDLSTVYAIVQDAGIFSYDIDTGKTDLVYEVEDVGIISYGHRFLTVDEKHIVYRAMNYDEEEDTNTLTYHAVDLDTNEKVDIGEGEYLFMQADGNVMLVDNDHVIYHFDFETEELTEVYSIELAENMELDNVTLSLDGSTIAYGYTETIEKDEDEDEEHFYLKIVRNH